MEEQYTALRVIRKKASKELTQVYQTYKGHLYLDSALSQAALIDFLQASYSEWYVVLRGKGTRATPILKALVRFTIQTLTQWHSFNWNRSMLPGQRSIVPTWINQQTHQALKIYTDGFLRLEQNIVFNIYDAKSREHWASLFFDQLHRTCDRLADHAQLEKKSHIRELIQTLRMAERNTSLVDLTTKKRIQTRVDDPEIPYKSGGGLITSNKDINYANLRYFFDTKIEQQHLALLTIWQEKQRFDEQQKTMEKRALWMRSYINEKALALRNFVLHFKRYTDLQQGGGASIGCIPFSSFIEQDNIKYFIDHIVLFFLKSAYVDVDEDVLVHGEVMEHLQHLGGVYKSAPKDIKARIRNMESGVSDKLVRICSNPQHVINDIEYGLTLNEYLEDHWIKLESNPFMQSILSFDMKLHLPYEKRTKHTYIIGKTGSGKTELLKQMIYKDIRDENSVFVLDPHGDLAEECRHFDLFKDPKIRKRLIYISPEFLSKGQIPAYNPFDWTPKGKTILEQRNSLSVRARELADSFEAVFRSEFTHNMQAILTNCIALLLEVPNTTLQDLITLLYPEGPGTAPYTEILEKHWNPMLRNYFVHMFPSKRLDTAKMAILTRFDSALSNQFIRHMFLSPKSSFNLEAALDDGAIVIVNAKQSALSAAGANILGALLTAELSLIAIGRADKPKNERKPVFAYIDECQNFLTNTIDKILSEARKYGIHLILSHQFLGQFEGMARVKQSIMANTAIKFCGRVSVQDQVQMSKETQYKFKPDEVLGKGQFICRIGSQPGLIVQVSPSLLPPIAQNEHYVTVSIAQQWAIEQWQQYYNHYSDQKGITASPLDTQRDLDDTDTEDFIPIINDL